MSSRGPKDRILDDFNMYRDRLEADDYQQIYARLIQHMSEKGVQLPELRQQQQAKTTNALQQPPGQAIVKLPFPEPNEIEKQGFANLAASYGFSGGLWTQWGIGQLIEKTMYVAFQMDDKQRERAFLMFELGMELKLIARWVTSQPVGTALLRYELPFSATDVGRLTGLAEELRTLHREMTNESERQYHKLKRTGAHAGLIRESAQYDQEITENVEYHCKAAWSIADSMDKMLSREDDGEALLSVSKMIELDLEKLDLWKEAKGVPGILKGSEVQRIFTQAYRFDQQGYKGQRLWKQVDWYYNQSEEFIEEHNLQKWKDEKNTYANYRKHAFDSFTRGYRRFKETRT